MIIESLKYYLLTSIIPILLLSTIDFLKWELFSPIHKYYSLFFTCLATFIWGHLKLSILVFTLIYERKSSSIHKYGFLILFNISFIYLVNIFYAWLINIFLRYFIDRSTCALVSILFATFDLEQHENSNFFLMVG